MKILLVEDEKELSKALSAILSKSNYAVDAALDGMEATFLLSRNTYDLIILDIMLPKKDGLTLLKEIREAKNEVPVIILSAKADIVDRIEGLDLGADDFLPKPFDVNELLARVRALTRRRTGNIVPELKFGNLTLDRNTCTITTPYGKEVLLNKELQILELLMLNTPKIVSTEKLIENVWPFESYSISNNLWVFLSYLRKKLTNVKANVVVKNHRNVGYYLEIINEEN